MIEYPFVGLAGNIGVGKTTFTEKMAKNLNWTPIYESVSDNPYLNEDYFQSILLDQDYFVLQHSLLAYQKNPTPLDVKR